MKFNKDNIFRLIASNKVNEALTELLDLVLKLGTDANCYKHELAILSNRYYALNQRKSNGTIKQDELEILNNRIIVCILELTDKISVLVKNNEKKHLMTLAENKCVSSSAHSYIACIISYFVKFKNLIF